MAPNAAETQPQPALRDRRSPSLSWRESGDLDLPLAVFFHGLGGDRTSWDSQLEALGSVRRCVAWELPGYGDSPGLIASLPDLAKLAASWIQDLGETRADIVGLSFGGMVAQHLALDYPEVVRSLTLMDTSPAFGMDGATTREDWLATRIAPMRETQMTERRAGEVVSGLVGAQCSDSVRRVAVSSMRRIPGPALAAACEALVHHDVRDRLGQVTAPTLVMVGEEDTETPPLYARTLADGIPGSNYLEIPKAGHLLNLECPEVVNGALGDHWVQAMHRKGEQ